MTNLDLYSALSPNGQRLAQYTCAITLWERCVQILQEPSGQPRCSTPQELLQHTLRIVEQRIGELAVLQAALKSAIEGKGIVEVLSASDDGKVLKTAWKALLECDLETLPTICPYADNDIRRASSKSNELFWSLIETAGITVLSDGVGGGTFCGHNWGSFTFMLGDKGLLVRHDNIFDSDADPPKDDHAFTTAVVTGTIVQDARGKKRLNLIGEPDNEPTTVKALAEAIAARLREYYTPK